MRTTLQSLASQCMYKTMVCLLAPQSTTIIIAVMELPTQSGPQTQNALSGHNGAMIFSHVTLYLIIALSATTFVFLLTIFVLAIVRCHAYCSQPDACSCSPCCGSKKKNKTTMKKAAKDGGGGGGGAAGGGGGDAAGGGGCACWRGHSPATVCGNAARPKSGSTLHRGQRKWLYDQNILL